MFLSSFQVQIPSEVEVSSILSQKTIRRLMIMEKVLSSSVPKLSRGSESTNASSGHANTYVLFAFHLFLNHYLVCRFISLHVSSWNLSSALQGPSASTNDAGQLRKVELGSGIRLKKISDKTADGLSQMMNPSALIGLISAVSFGYGLLQLCFSMIPPSLTCVTRILGFQGNRELGLKCLNFASSGQDMHLPFAL
jgi:hypothetical protein